MGKPTSRRRTEPETRLAKLYALLAALDKSALDAKYGTPSRLSLCVALTFTLMFLMFSELPPSDANDTVASRAGSGGWGHRG